MRATHPDAPLKYVCDVNADTLPETTSPDWEFEYIDIGNVDRHRGVTATEWMRFADAPSRARRRVRVDDVIISTVRTYLRAATRIAGAHDGAVASTGFAVLSPRRSAVEPRFLGYAVTSPVFVDGVVSRSVGVSYPAINPSVLARMAIPAPSLPAQCAIADFLDRECARIDQLVLAASDLERAVLGRPSQLFTRLVGGETVPRVRVKFALRSIEQGWSPLCESQQASAGGWGVLKVGAVNYAVFRPAEHKALPDELRPRKDLLVRRGDLLMSRANTRALVGSVAIVDDTGPWRLLLCDKLYRLGVREDRVNAAFLKEALNSGDVRNQIELAISGASSSMQNISQELVRSLEVPFPSVSRQAEISRDIQAERARSAKCRGSSKRLRTSLTEYRDALITEAVTGQLDVTRLSDAQLDESARAAAEGEAPEVLAG